ncbi:MAG: fibronectin type III domain-containing protein [Armatimonadota bacterium]
MTHSSIILYAKSIAHAMTIRKIRTYIGIVTLGLLAASMPSWIMAATPAGTQIQANSTAKYYSGTSTLMPTVTSNTVITTVGQSALVTVSPASASKPVDANKLATFALTVTNKGNGTDTFDLTTISSSGSTVAVYKDDNNDGQWQSTEVTKVTATPSMTIDGSFKCLVTAQLSASNTLSSDVVKFTAKSRLDITKSADATLTVQGKSPYILSWLLNGYYSNTNTATRLSTDYLGGEANVTPSEGSTSGGKTWKAFTSTTSPIVNLATAFGAQTNVAGYAHVYVYSPTAQQVGLWLGSDNGIKVWLNGVNVWTNDSARGLTPDQDKRTVSLTQGWNRLLLKISQYGGNWGFTAKLCDASGNPVPGLEYSLDPPVVNDQTPPVITNVKVTPGSTTAIVEWDTNEASDSVVSYGTGTDLSLETEDLNMVTHHKVTLSNLTAKTQYSLKVGSADQTGNTAWCSVCTFTTSASGTTYILSWLLNGYYSNTNTATRLSTDYIGGEANTAPVTGGISGGKTWKAFTSTTSPIVNLVTAFGAQTYVAGYAHVYVYSPTAQQVGLWLGSDNGIKVWLNGVNVWTNDSTRGLTPDQDKRTVSLTQGWNRLLLKISQYGGNWGFTAKLCDASGNPVPGLEYSLDPPTAAGDITIPVIDNIKVTPGSTSAVVEWDTDEESDSTVIYGTTVDLSETLKDTNMVLHHKMVLDNLMPNTTYGIKVRSIDASGNYRWVGPDTFTTAASQNATQYIQSWLINGFYKNSDRSTRMTTDYLGGEAVMAPLNGNISGGNTWTAYDSPDTYIDLGTGFGNPTGCAGYAFAYVYSPVAQTVNIWSGSDDGIRILVNGATVWNNDTYRSMIPDQDKATANLAAGWNRLLVKITQGGSGWGFTLKICDANGNQIPGIYYATGP